MGRELKRVPTDFDWPLNQTWKGYVSPFRMLECDACDGSGQSEESKKLEDAWFGRKNGRRSPGDDGWRYRLEQEEVDALKEAGRLDHKIEIGVIPEDPTPDDVNEHFRGASMPGGHDAINRWICIKARCKKLGLDIDCSQCDGKGGFYFSDEIKERAENFWEEERYDPPEGDGWQVWETVSEGSPITPVFETAQKLIDHLVEHGAWNDWSREAAENFVKNSKWAPSFVASSDGLQEGYEAG